ncbi:hypothetical protein [Floridanema evergladense]|uniref:Uncharacterized protein n=1 Tax=Floridaenema evergladense BLCC-F167 TaxID=3153639 RepID=A0ABV4WJF6_9CYAN
MFGFIKNIFSSNKSDSTKPKTKKQKGYFLELDDSANPQTTNGSKAAETPKAEPAPVAKTSPTEVQETVTLVEPTTTETKPEPAKAETKPAKTSIKKAKPAPAEKPEPVATPAPAVATEENSQPEPEQTFAPKYLASTGSNGRRRPGANMSSYLEMARQVKSSK